MFTNKSILITGGTGSFGNAVLKRILNTDVREIRIFSRDEKKQFDMRLEYNNSKINFIVGDVRNYDSVYKAVEGVDYIFHAAALKQVPSCEFFPLEAVRTNILGANNVMDAAIACNVKKMIVLSTDKAVYPINAMGISKAMMEKLTMSKSWVNNHNNKHNGTVLCCTRYGNVMASRGSVIPLFVNQIKSGNDITITNPRMTRFLMSLDDAINLVFYAFENGECGDLFVMKAPAATLHDLAVAIKKIFQSNVNIKVIGTRHGEKLHETLVTKEEKLKAEESENYFRIRADLRDQNYYQSADKSQFLTKKYNDYTSQNTKRLKVDEIIELLLKLDYIKEELNGGGK